MGDWKKRFVDGTVEEEKSSRSTLVGRFLGLGVEKDLVGRQIFGGACSLPPSHPIAGPCAHTRCHLDDSVCLTRVTVGTIICDELGTLCRCCYLLNYIFIIVAA